MDILLSLLGSESVLKRMNRKYTTTQYKEFVAKLRKAIPTIALTTDVIVGFPTESENDFLESLSFISSVFCLFLFICYN